jgi:hypothetical protein
MSTIDLTTITTTAANQLATTAYTIDLLSPVINDLAYDIDNAEESGADTTALTSTFDTLADIKSIHEASIRAISDLNENLHQVALGDRAFPTGRNALSRRLRLILDEADRITDSTPPSWEDTAAINRIIEQAITNIGEQ